MKKLSMKSLVAARFRLRKILEVEPDSLLPSGSYNPEDRCSTCNLVLCTRVDREASSSLMSGKGWVAFGADWNERELARRDIYCKACVKAARR